MKLKSIFVSMFALAALASCSNDDEGVTNLPTDQSPAEAYLALTIKTPQPAFGGTRAAATEDGAPGDEQGSQSESSVNNALVVGLLADKSIEVYTWEGTQKTGSFEFTGDAIGVSSSLDSIFVVVNPSDLAKQQIGAAHKTSSRELVFRAIKEVVGNISGDNKFMMTSEGSSLNAAWTKAKVKEVTTTSDAAKDAAKADQTLVNVDRVVAKATLSNHTPTFENGSGKLLGFQLNTTNKNYLPYADLISYKLADGSASAAKYRKDANWEILAMQWGKDDDGKKIIQGPAFEAFNWLNNATDDVDGKWLGLKTPSYTYDTASSYCHENTMKDGSSNAQNYNNTTKMVIKAKYTPTKNGLNEGDSWFRVDGAVMTFAELDASYKDASATDKLKYSAFLDKLLGTGRTKGWTDEKTAAVSLADLEAVSNGGYKAATVDSITVDGKKVNAYLIEFFQKSNSYYDVNIKHDNRVSPRSLGRWGMVRNNWYTLTVNKISNAGKPYIPDPTDPDITDPTNPNPEKPTPDDDDAFIAVTITVNNWTTWSQGVDL